MKENTIICGDCLEVVKDWPDGCVDLVVTSPPYDNLRDYHGYVQIPVGTIARELWRVVKDGGIVVWIVGDAVVEGSETGTSFITALTFISPPKRYQWRLHDTMIYNRPCAYPGNTRYSQDFEYMFVFSKNKPVTTNIIKDIRSLTAGRSAIKKGKLTKSGKRVDEKGNRIRPEYKERPNIWTYNAGGGHNDKVAYEHPAIFPEKLAADHIKSWSNPGELVVDIFSGSGTTCKMASRLGRRYIGIDISSDYCDIARKRLESVDTGVPVKERNAGQMPMFPAHDG